MHWKFSLDLRDRNRVTRLAHTMCHIGLLMSNIVDSRRGPGGQSNKCAVQCSLYDGTLEFHTSAKLCGRQFPLSWKGWLCEVNSYWFRSYHSFLSFLRQIDMERILWLLLIFAICASCAPQNLKGHQIGRKIFIFDILNLDVETTHCYI